MTTDGLRIGWPPSSLNSAIWQFWGTAMNVLQICPHLTLQIQTDSQNWVIGLWAGLLGSTTRSPQSPPTYARQAYSQEMQFLRNFSTSC